MQNNNSVPILDLVIYAIISSTITFLVSVGLSVLFGFNINLVIAAITALVISSGLEYYYFKKKV